MRGENSGKAASPRRVRVSQVLREKAFARDHFTCVDCRRQLVGGLLDADHVKPVAHGGTNTLANIVTRCKVCNVRRGTKKVARPYWR